MTEKERERTADDRWRNTGGESNDFAGMWRTMGRMNSEDMAKMMGSMSPEDMAKMMGISPDAMQKMMEACCPDGVDMCGCMSMMMKAFSGAPEKSDD